MLLEVIGGACRYPPQTAPGVPLGYLCEKCLLGSSAGAALRVRARAEELRSLLARANLNFPAEQWANMRRSMQKRMEYWLSLANEIEKMTW